MILSHHSGLIAMFEFVRHNVRGMLTPVAACAVALVCIGSSNAAEPSKDLAAVDASADAKGWFDAMDGGELDVRIIMQNSKRANILFKNTTDKDLMVRLPKTFASVPAARFNGKGGVLGQMGGMGGGMGGMGGGMGGMGGGGMGGGGGGQAGGGGMGGGGMGGMGGMGGGMGGMGGGMGGMMRIPPEKQQKMAVTIVCLEHGRPDPRPKIEYRMVPLERFSSDARIGVVCEALGNGQLTQKTAQAAAWNIMDNLSWNELATKNEVESRYTGNVRWFSPMELRMAYAVVGEATRIANEMSDSDASSSENTTGEFSEQTDSSRDSNSQTVAAPAAELDR